MDLKSGHTAVPLSVEDGATSKGPKMIRLQPEPWVYSEYFLHFADKYFDFQFKTNDVVIMTYPKCGTTWLQEIIWTMMKNPNLDHKDALVYANLRSPFLDFDHILRKKTTENMFEKFLVEAHPDRDPSDGIFLQLSELAEDPRIIKTHLPFSLLSPDLLDTCKVIYGIRNPKDVVVSFHHHMKLLSNTFNVTFSEFLDKFIDDTHFGSPYWTHVKQAWTKRNYQNLHICFYEDIKADPKAEITRLQEFLGTHLTDDQINKVVEYTSFSAMKSRDCRDELFVMKSETGEQISTMNLEVREKEGGFFRKGEAGDWKNKLTKEQVERMDEWTKKNAATFGENFRYVREIN